MAKKAETKEYNVDLTKPFNIDDVVVDSDCYGKEYDPADSQCSVCSVHEICGILKTKLVKELGHKIKKPTEHYVDEWDFSQVPVDNMLQLFKDNPYQYTTEDILSVVEDKSKCEDRTTCIQWLKNFFVENNIGTKDGKIYVKDA